MPNFNASDGGFVSLGGKVTLELNELSKRLLLIAGWTPPQPDGQPSDAFTQHGTLAENERLSQHARAARHELAETIIDELRRAAQRAKDGAVAASSTHDALIDAAEAGAYRDAISVVEEISGLSSERCTLCRHLVVQHGGDGCRNRTGKGKCDCKATHDR